MPFKLGRRHFVKGVALAGSFGIVNPLGLLGSKTAMASIPTGDYLTDRDPTRFWFRKLKTDTTGVTNPATLKPVESPEGQLSLRIGASGGFAIGYFSTLSFLSSYKATSPDDYLDLIGNSAKIPDSPNKNGLILRMLDVHRRTSGKSLNSQGSALRTGYAANFPASASKPIKQVREKESQKAQALTTSSLSSPLEKIPSEVLALAHQRVSNDSKVSRIFSLGANNSASELPQLWQDASDLAQRQLTSEFDAYSTSWDYRLAAVDASRLMTYEGGKLKLEWLDDVLLALEFQSGVEQGRLAALANSAFNDVAGLMSTEPGLDSPPSGIADSELINRISQKLVKLRLADQISSCFGADTYWRYAFDVAAFRPAVRIKLSCILNTIDVGPRSIELVTPFLPFDSTREFSPKDLSDDRSANREISSIVVDSFSDPSVSRYNLPAVTAALPQAAFQPCSEMTRHTIRLLEMVSLTNSEIFSKSSLTSIVAVPEVTSPWTFAGVSAAFCNTYLMALDQNKLNSEEARSAYRKNVGMAVDSLLKQSVGRGAPGANNSAEAVANSSPFTPAMIQYASGYRAATVFSDRVTDQIAQADGARKVYKNLQVAMPEYFTELADDKFLTAEVIAGQVLVVATSVQSEINRLKDEVAKLQLKVEQLEITLKQYETFINDFKSLIESFQSQLTGVRTQDDLRKFKEKNQDIMARLSSAFDDSQKSMVGSMQGLVNTFVTVSNEITANVTAELRAEFNAKIDARVAEKAKTQVNVCSVGNQK